MYCTPSQCRVQLPYAQHKRQSTNHFISIIDCLLKVKIQQMRWTDHSIISFSCSFILSYHRSSEHVDKKCIADFLKSRWQQAKKVNTCLLGNSAVSFFQSVHIVDHFYGIRPINYSCKNCTTAGFHLPLPSCKRQSMNLFIFIIECLLDIKLQQITHTEHSIKSS